MKARLLKVLIFEVVINTEWGALGNTGSLDFVRTWWDHGVDAGSKNFGKQVLKSAAIFANAHFLFCCKLCPKLIVNRLKSGLFKGLWKADQWDVPWRTFQTGGFQQKFRNLKSTFYSIPGAIGGCRQAPPLPRGGRDENSRWARLSPNSIHLGDWERWARRVFGHLGGASRAWLGKTCNGIRLSGNQVRQKQFSTLQVWQTIVFKWSKLFLTDTSPSALGSERPRLRRRELRVCSTRWTGGGTWKRAFCSEEIFIDFE